MEIESVKNEQVEIPDEVRDLFEQRQRDWEREVEIEGQLEELARPSDEELRYAEEISTGLARAAGAEEPFQKLIETAQQRAHQIDQLLNSDG